MLVLAIESSSSSAKALLYDSEKGIIKESEQAYSDTVIQTGMRDAQKIFEQSVQIARKIARGRDVAAIALSGVWHSLIVCDSDLKPVTPEFSWDFTGAADLCRAIRADEKATDWIYRTTGCMPNTTYPRHVLPLLAQNGLDLKNKKLITQGGYNFYRLTGEYLESVCIQSGNGLLNLKKLEYDEEVLAYFGISKDQLGKLVSFEDVRPLSTEGAQKLGLIPGIPVIPAYADGALNQIGNCANRPGRMTLSVGTSGAIRLAATKPLLPKGRELWCYFGTDKWISGAASSGACNCVDWFRESLLSGARTFGEMEAMQSLDTDVPVFLPFLVGERCPGWNDSRRGGFVRVEKDHTQADLYKAVQMGVLFNLYQCYKVLCKENGTPKEILVSGGIVNSGKWLHMAADIFERDLLVSVYQNASLMGAVALALHAVGELENINDFRADYDSSFRVACDTSRFSYYRRQYERYQQAYEEVWL